MQMRITEIRVLWKYWKKVSIVKGNWGQDKFFQRDEASWEVLGVVFHKNEGNLGSLFYFDKM